MRRCHAPRRLPRSSRCASELRAVFFYGTTSAPAVRITPRVLSPDDKRAAPAFRGKRGSWSSLVPLSARGCRKTRELESVGTAQRPRFAANAGAGVRWYHISTRGSNPTAGAGVRWYHISTRGCRKTRELESVGTAQRPRRVRTAAAARSFTPPSSRGECEPRELPPNSSRGSISFAAAATR